MRNIFFILCILCTYSSILNAQEKGILKFNVNVDSIAVIIDNDFMNAKTIASSDSILIHTGQHLINISTPFNSPYVRYVRIFSDQAETVEHDFVKTEELNLTIERNHAARKYYNADIMILTDSSTEIFYQDSLIGKGFGKVESNIGFNEITLRNEYFGTSSLIITKSNSAYISLRESYLKPDKRTAERLSVIPGGSQFYKKQYLKSSLFLVGTSVLILGSFSSHGTYKNELDIFDDLKEKYNNATNEWYALQIGNRIEEQQDVVRKANNIRRSFIVMTLLSYTYNLYDAFKSTPKGGYRNIVPLEFYLSQNPDNSTMATVRYNF